jgi:hypothetical protein
MTATLDPATVTAVTLSNGNLTATNTETTSQNQGAHVASGSGQTSGKFYFEITWTTINGGDYCAGVGTPTSTYSGMGFSGGVTGIIGVAISPAASIWQAGANSGSFGGTPANGDIIGIAIDLDNRKGWFKKVSGTPGNWNGSGANDPATNSGGITVPAGTMVPFVVFGGSGGAAGAVQTANFGATSFTGLVPSGFTSGWPDPASFVPPNPWAQAAPLLAM